MEKLSYHDYLLFLEEMFDFWWSEMGLESF